MEKGITYKEQVNNWLEIAFTSPANRKKEFFYYDRRDQQFFSILAADYFIVDENYQVPKEVTVSYSPATIHLLSDRMRRIDSEDKNIIPVPDGHDTPLMQEKISAFLGLHDIDLKATSIWETEESDFTIHITKKEE